MIGRNMRITTDYLEVYDTNYQGFQERKVNNVLFQRNMLVKLPSGYEAMIDNLSFEKAAVCTEENELIYVRID